MIKQMAIKQATEARGIFHPARLRCPSSPSPLAAPPRTPLGFPSAPLHTHKENSYRGDAQWGTREGYRAAAFALRVLAASRTKPVRSALPASAARAMATRYLFTGISSLPPKSTHPPAPPTLGDRAGGRKFRSALQERSAEIRTCSRLQAAKGV